MAKTAEQKSAIIEKRAWLSKLSRNIKSAMQDGRFAECATINEALVEIYKEESGASEFKTFNQWKDAGYFIKKGSKAYLVWGQPKGIPHPDENSDKDEMQYFPLCYLFSDLQVEKKMSSQETQTTEA